MKSQFELELEEKTKNKEFLLNIKNIEPKNGTILVKPPIISQKTKGGIIKTDRQKEIEEKELGRLPIEIIKVSETIIDYKKGDNIFLSNSSNPETLWLLDANGNDDIYLVIRVGDIIAKCIYVE
jgi:co-chaperonin GroES (HSP10)